MPLSKRAVTCCESTGKSKRIERWKAVPIR
jgi:hypothetical protein